VKLRPVTSSSLFKGTVILLGISSVLLLTGFFLIVVVRLVLGTVGGGIGSFTFAVTLPELRIVCGLILGVFVLLYGLGRALVHHHKRSETGAPR
jgi:hypothetical protein